MFTSMKKLIERKFYKTAEDAQAKLDVFFAMSRLDIDEYAELTMLLEAVYAPPVVEQVVENVEPIPNTENSDNSESTENAETETVEAETPEVEEQVDNDEVLPNG